MLLSGEKQGIFKWQHFNISLYFQRKQSPLKFSKLKRKFLCMAAIWLTGTAQSQWADSVKILDPVTVTAARTIRKQSETGKVVTIIQKEQLLLQPGKSLGEILNQQAAVFIAGANNSPGSNQEIYVRGSGKMLILLNGIPVYDASTINNSFDLNSIPVESIEKIEILKGAESTLYGSDAVAGVINLITKTNTNKEVEGYLHLSGGSYGTVKQEAGLSGNTDGTFYQLQIQHLKTDGFSAANDSSGKGHFDRDGISQINFSGTLSGWVTKSLNLGLQTRFGNYRAGADGGAFTDDHDYTIKNLDFRLGMTATYLFKKGALHYHLFFSGNNRKYLNDSSFISGFSIYSKENYTGNSHFMELYSTQHLGSHLEWTSGADYRWLNSDQHYFSVSAFGPYSTSIGKDSVHQKTNSVYTSFLLKNVKGWNLELGGRLNISSNYGKKTTYTINPGFSINQNLRMFVNISSAFKTPGLYQLFGPGVENRNLKAETAANYEGGVQFANEQWNIRTVYFNRTIKNGIDYNYSTNAYFNNNIQKDHGAELELTCKTGKFRFTGNYTYLTGAVNSKKFVFNTATYSYDIKGDTLYNNLFRRPKNSINVLIGYQPFTNWYFSTRIRSIGKRQEGQFEAAPIALSRYYTADLSVSCSLPKKIRLYIDWSNMTNRHYMDVWGYNTRGNNITAGIQIMF
jgi:vitamin B12 transporter